MLYIFVEHKKVNSIVVLKNMFRFKKDIALILNPSQPPFTKGGETLPPFGKGD